MKLNTKQLAVMTIFAAMYAVCVVPLAGLSFYAVQVRIADAMLPLSMIFGLPGAFGLSLGCLVSNVFGGLGPIDIFGGAAANLVACVLAWYIGRRGTRIRRFGATLVQTAVIALIVGSYLSFLLGITIGLEIFLVLVGEIIAVNLVGFPIQEALRKTSILSKFAEGGQPQGK